MSDLQEAEATARRTLALMSAEIGPQLTRQFEVLINDTLTLRKGYDRLSAENIRLRAMVASAKFMATGAPELYPRELIVQTLSAPEDGEDG